MGDIHCAKCCEPWDYCGLVDDVEPGERERILNGEGCPSCDFGENTKCCQAGCESKHLISLLNNSEGDELATF